jgi:hypothetical protein
MGGTSTNQWNDSTSGSGSSNDMLQQNNQGQDNNQLDSQPQQGDAADQPVQQ